MLTPSLPPPRRDPVTAWVEYLDELVGDGGPQPDEYPRLNRCFADLSRMAGRDALGPAIVAAARAALAPTLLRATLLGFLHLRLHGHPGDFEFLERILSYHHSADPNLVCWDRYCHALPAAMALRSRASHLRSILAQIESETPDGPAHALHFRCGPAREFADYFIAHGARSRLRCDCVDPDPAAIRHGRRSVARLTDRMAFHAVPLLRFHPAHRYRLIWVSVLCEGLTDRALVIVMRRLISMLEPGGRLVLCQLAAPDASTPLLEVVAGWRLSYRGASDLERLARMAGADPDAIRICREPAHANLYLHVVRSPGSRATSIRSRGRPSTSS